MTILQSESLERFEITSGNVDRVCDQFRDADYPQAARIFREALGQMDFDTEMLWDFVDFYRDHLAGDNAYGPVEFETALFPSGDARRIAKLVNKEQSLVDCHMLSMLAIENCLEIYNHLVGELPPYDAGWILDLTCEASEAVALARTSTAMIDLYYGGLSNGVEKLERSKERNRQSLKKAGSARQRNRERTKCLARTIAEAAWATYPDVYTGSMANKVWNALTECGNRLFGPPTRRGDPIYGPVSERALKTLFDEEFPSKKAAAGRPPESAQPVHQKVELLINAALENALET